MAAEVVMETEGEVEEDLAGVVVVGDVAVVEALATEEEEVAAVASEVAVEVHNFSWICSLLF